MLWPTFDSFSTFNRWDNDITLLCSDPLAHELNDLFIDLSLSYLLIWVWPSDIHLRHSVINESSKLYISNRQKYDIVHRKYSIESRVEFLQSCRSNYHVYDFHYIRIHENITLEKSWIDEEVKWSRICLNKTFLCLFRYDRICSIYSDMWFVWCLHFYVKTHRIQMLDISMIDHRTKNQQSWSLRTSVLCIIYSTSYFLRYDQIWFIIWNFEKEKYIRLFFFQNLIRSYSRSVISCHQPFQSNLE